MLTWRLLQTVVLLLGHVCVCGAQEQRLGVPKAVTLRLIVSVDGDVEKAANVTVELMDAVGSGGALDSKFTDNSGIVIFRTLDGLHRYRITGPHIQAYEGELRIMPNETSHVEHIRVHQTTGRQPTSESPSQGRVAAARLNAWALATAANAELLTHEYDEAIAHARKLHTVPHAGMAGVHFVAALALEATQQPVEALKEYYLYLQEVPDGRDAERARKAIARLSGSPTN